MAAVDNSTCLTGCSGPTPACEKQHVCIVSDNWQVINHTIQRLFESVTVADLGGNLTLDSIASKLLSLELGQSRGVV
jgi:DNA-binding IscR family transcriptional regulator